VRHGGRQLQNKKSKMQLNLLLIVDNVFAGSIVFSYMVVCFCVTRCLQALCSQRVFCPVYNTLRLFPGQKRKKRN